MAQALKYWPFPASSLVLDIRLETAWFSGAVDRLQAKSFHIVSFFFSLCAVSFVLFCILFCFVLVLMIHFCLSLLIFQHIYGFLGRRRETTSCLLERYRHFWAGGGAHAGIWGGWVHVEPSPWFEVLLFFWLPVYFNLFNGNDVWKERFYCLLKQWKHNCKERVKKINFSYTSYYRFYAHNTQSAMAEKGHIYVRKKKHINKKNKTKQTTTTTKTQAEQCLVLRRWELMRQNKLPDWFLHPDVRKVSYRPIYRVIL